MSQGTFDACACAQAYASPLNIQQWLLAGASPRTLALEIGALLLHLEADAGIVKRLDDIRALLHRHKDFLQDTAKWPVPHAVEQLAAQDLGALVQHETDGSGGGESSNTTRKGVLTVGPMCHLIQCITPSSATGCRWSIQGDGSMSCVAFPPDMRKLARGEGERCIVSCAASGIELMQMKGHR